jgi:hypothetical protein
LQEPDDIHLRLLPAWVRKSEHTTDGYLLALAKSHGGRLATLDRFIPDAVFIPDDANGPLMVRDEATARHDPAPPPAPALFASSH